MTRGKKKSKKSSFFETALCRRSFRSDALERHRIRRVSLDEEDYAHESLIALPGGAPAFDKMHVEITLTLPTMRLLTFRDA